MPNASAIVLHSVSSAIMAWGWFALGSLGLDAHIRGQYGGHSQYLTIHGLFLAFFTMVASFLADLIPSSQIIKSVKRTLMLCAMPVSIVISSIYWTLIFAAPSLMLQSSGIPAGSTDFSSSPDEALMSLVWIPLPIDLALHAIPAIALAIDFFVLERKYSPRAAKFGAPLALAPFAFGYISWVEHCAANNGDNFPYPFLTLSPFEGRIGIYFGACAIALLSLVGLNSLHK
ncbi:hypothetical protein FISHEDRAFT_65426 [Fistulina hepatica ATCC 64428]|nr:hypothetical protein FISHEDRAFT_65426 [Fistulina hepatica ATCC 64428]